MQQNDANAADEALPLSSGEYPSADVDADDSTRIEGSTEVKQSLTLCILLMSLSGLLRVVATMVLAYPDFVAKKNRRSRGVGNDDSLSSIGRFMGTFYVACHVLLLGVAAVVSIVGSFFGPVSIAVPVQTGSQLLFNVVAMGAVLKMRNFDKAQRTGTYVVFFSVLSLIDVGPGLQDNQNVMELLSKPDALIWSTFLSLAMIVAALFTIPLLFSRSDGGDGNGDGNFFERHSFLTLTVGVTVSNVGMATSGKTLGMLTSDEALAMASLYYVSASILGLLFSVVSATKCEQGIFTPLSSVALIIVNMITGIIVWEDWKVIDMWIGYMCACMLMCWGVYLLAEVDLIDNLMKRKEAEIVGLAPTSTTTTTTTLDGSEMPNHLPMMGDSMANDKQERDVWNETLETTNLTNTVVPEGYT